VSPSVSILDEHNATAELSRNVVVTAAKPGFPSLNWMHASRPALGSFVDTAQHIQTRCWLKGDNISDLEFVGWHIQYRNLTPWISRGYRHHRAAFLVRWEKPPSVLIGHTRDGSLRFDG
jgi:hypothetical protein